MHERPRRGCGHEGGGVCTSEGGRERGYARAGLRENGARWSSCTLGAMMPWPSCTVYGYRDTTYLLNTTRNCALQQYQYSRRPQYIFHMT